MAKLAGLQAAQELLTISRTNCARHFLQGFTPHPDDGPHEPRLVAASLLLVEIEDHLHNLTGIAVAAQHGLAGTTPDDFWPPENYDPYAVMTEHLTDEFCLPVGRLSAALQARLDEQPGHARRAAETIPGITGRPYLGWIKGEDGRLRPATPEEEQRAPETEMLRSLEQNFFVLNYAADLAEVAALVETRGSLARIAQLVA